MPVEKQNFSFDFKADSDESGPSGPSKLPTSYTFVGPSKAGKPKPPNSTQSKISKSAHFNGSADDAMEWVQQLSKPDVKIKKRCSFSTFITKIKRIWMWYP